MHVRKAQKMRNMLMLAGFVIMLGAYLYEPFFVIGFIVMFSCLIPHFLYNKCPHCRKQLGGNEADFCRFCGERID